MITIALIGDQSTLRDWNIKQYCHWLARCPRRYVRLALLSQANRTTSRRGANIDLSRMLSMILDER